MNDLYNSNYVGGGGGNWHVMEHVRYLVHEQSGLNSAKHGQDGLPSILIILFIYLLTLFLVNLYFIIIFNNLFCLVLLFFLLYLFYFIILFITVLFLLYNLYNFCFFYLNVLFYFNHVIKTLYFIL